MAAVVLFILVLKAKQQRFRMGPTNLCNISSKRERTVNGTEVTFESGFKGTVCEFTATITRGSKVLPEECVIDMSYSVISLLFSMMISKSEHIPPPLNFRAACNLILSLGDSVLA